MKRIQDRGLTILFTAFAAVLSAASAFLILKRTVAGSVLADPGTKMMVLELAVLLIWLFIAFYFFRGSNVSLVLCVVVPYVFLWLHRIALPVLAAGAYAAYLILLGELLGTVCGGRKENDRIMGYAHDFVLGSSLQIVIVCMFSAFGIGGAVFFRRQVIVTAVIAGIALYLLKAGAWLTGNAVELLPDEGELKKEEKYRALISAALAVIFTFLLMQAARINIAADYDSLHYGLRSQYVLDNGHGIYENLGSINDVYFYPKGLEILTLPLSNRISFGFVTAFSWWMTAGSLVMIFRAVCLRTKRRFGIYAVAAACLIPGIIYRNHLDK